jgi:putative resolvase
MIKINGGETMLLKVKDVARALNVHRTSVERWIKEGKLKAVKLPSGYYRIPEEELNRLLNKPSSERKE